MATMRYPLTLPAMVERAERFFPRTEIVSRTSSGIVRYTYREYGERVRRLASALAASGIQKGDRVGTLAWNHHRHLEAYFAIPAMGAVLHTLNHRLPPAHLAYVINHASDRTIIVDEDLLPLLECLAPELRTVEQVIVITEGEVLPRSRLPQPASYEALLAGAEPMRRWPELDEWDPAEMCFSSATTGMPKGVIYTHRALWLHGMACCLADTLAISHKDSMLIIVPLFHANGWGLAQAGVWMGAKIVLPGPRPDPRVYCELMRDERVTYAFGVPTIWIGVLAHLDKEPCDFPHLGRILCGGAAAPRALVEAVEKRLRVRFIHGYGMTEAAPVTHVGGLKAHMAEWDERRLYDVKAKPGILLPGLEMRLVGPDGTDAPWDGETMGEVWLRGPWIADEYYHDARSAETFQGGWYRSGDVATVDAEGYLTIVDRMKDLIKSGGEWISSADLENTIMAHPSVAEAAVVGAEHRKWQERPIACVVPKPGRSCTKEEILEHLKGKIASWWMPDDVVFIDEVPKTSVGKFDKKVLRERYRQHLLRQDELAAPPRS